MRKFLDSICLGMIVLMLATVGMAFADTYINTLPIRVLNNSTNVYNNISLLVDINNTQLYQYGYINSTGLNTNVQEGATAQEYMVGTSKLPIFASLFNINQDRTYKYRLGYSPDKSPGLFPVMVGYGGDLQVTDNDVTLELGNNFTIEQDGFIDTSVSGQNLIHKYIAFKTYVPAVGVVNSTIITHGAPTDVTLYPSGGGVFTEFSVVFGAPTHWEAVDEVVADDDTTYIETTDTLGPHSNYWWDTYNIDDDQIPDESIINSVKVYFRVRSTSAGTGFARPLLYLQGGTTVGVEVGALTGAYVTHSEILSRPGGGSWYWEDINSLQVGVGGFGQSGFLTRCTQVYVVVNYDPPVYTEVTAPCSSGEHVIKTTADTVDLKIYIDGVEKDSVALGGVSVTDNGWDWYFMEDNTIPYLDKMEICIPPGTGALWFEPNTMVDLDNVPDRWGNGNTGKINWGTNPSGFEVFIGGMEPYEDYVSSVTEEEVIPEVFNVPTGLGPTVDASEVVVSGLSQYPLFQRAAASMGWTTVTLYGMMMIIPAIVMGFAVLVATNSMLFGGLAFASILGIAAGTTIIPWWMPVIAFLGVGFGTYLVMRT